MVLDPLPNWTATQRRGGVRLTFNHEESDLIGVEAFDSAELGVFCNDKHTGRRCSNSTHSCVACPTRETNQQQPTRGQREGPSRPAGTHR